MIKAIFFDVDGTLVSHRMGKVPESTRRSLLKLREKNIKIFMSTGRHLWELGKLPLEGLPFDGYITLNGQLCADGNKQVLFRAPLAKEDSRILADIFQEKEQPLMLVEENRLYINFINDVVCQTQKEISTPLPLVSEYEGASVYMAIAFLKPGEEYILEDRMPPNCKMTRWGSGGVDIIPKFGGKVTGIKNFLQYYGISQDEIMAVGDGENDMEMLEFAGIGVAMGNAEDYVKEKADYITADIDEDGIEKALQYFGLI